MRNFRNLLAATAIAAVASVAMASSAAADVLYDDGAINGTFSAWTINFGFAVSDSFTLATASTVTGVTFGAWTYGGDTINAVDWAITTTPNSYPIDGTAAVTNTFQFTNGYGYDINLASFSTGSLSLAAGTYYLVLQNAQVSNNDPGYWDNNGGPSVAYENTIGNVQDSFVGPGSNAESFQILGTSGAPEPAGWALMIGGFGLAGAALRRRTAAVAA